MARNRQGDSVDCDDAITGPRGIVTDDCKGKLFTVFRGGITGERVVINQRARLSRDTTRYGLHAKR